MTDETLTLADGSAMTVRLYGGGAAPGAGSPSGATSGVTSGATSAAMSGAFVLHFHGGGFIGGSLDSGATVARVLAEHAAVVASLDYPLAPARPFPQAVEAGYRALQWLDERRLKGRRRHRPAPLFVAGEDAGGNIAAAVALIARDRGGPALAGQILLSPMLDACIATASQRAANDGPLGCPCADGWRAYLAQATDGLHPYATPGTSLRLAGLPPTLLLTSQDDPLRDEALAYGRRLREAGVEAHASVLPMATGWPRSYAESGAFDKAAWISPLLERVRPFLSPQARSFETATASSTSSSTSSSTASTVS